MDSREKILNAVKNNQPPLIDLIDVDKLLSAQPSDNDAMIEQYGRILQSIGGHSKSVNSYAEIIESLKQQFPEAKRIVSSFKELKDIAEIYSQGDIIAAVEDIDVAILPGHFGVAENGAVWLTEDNIIDRALPFVCQHLVAIIPAGSLVSTMHDAYNKIGDGDYGFSIFIAGPSKTADIEQSLVLGAHGPLSMTVFLMS